MDCSNIIPGMVSERMNVMNHELKAKSDVNFLLSLVVLLTFLVSVMIAPPANSMLVAEVEPGVIELNTTTINGFRISDYAERSVKGKSWVYFCVQSPNQKKSSKCFYGPKEEFKEVKIGLSLNGIQYSLKNRIVNNKGHIPVQKSSYFYRALTVRPQS